MTFKTSYTSELVKTLIIMYIQAVGRAGRDGNNSDVSTSIKLYIVFDEQIDKTSMI